MLIQFCVQKNKYKWGKIIIFSGSLRLLWLANVIALEKISPLHASKCFENIIHRNQHYATNVVD